MIKWCQFSKLEKVEHNCSKSLKLTSLKAGCLHLKLKNQGLTSVHHDMRVGLSSFEQRLVQGTATQKLDLSG